MDTKNETNNEEVKTILPEENNNQSTIPLVDDTKKEEPTPVETKEEKVEEVVEEKVEEPLENIELNNQEQIVYQYKPEKEHGPGAILAMFGIIIVIIIFLPTIQEKVKEFTAEDPVVYTPTTTDDDNKKEEETEELEFLDLAESTSVDIKSLNLAKFTKTFTDDYYINFNLMNNGKESYQYKDKIYIELYSEDKTLLSRSILYNDTELFANDSIELSLVINDNAYESASLIVVREITEENYPVVELEQDIKDQEVLTCTYKDRSIKYTFNELRLIAIENTYDVKIDNNDIESYTAKLNARKKQSVELDLKDGVSSSYADAINGYIIITELDLKVLQEDELKAINDNNYYYYQQYAKVVKYEQLAKGYTCE